MANVCYLVVVHIDNQHYIQLVKDDEGNFNLSAFETVEKALNQFDGFKRKIYGMGYESHVSAGLGIINLNPHIIEVPMDNPESLGKYVIDMAPIIIRGSLHGAFVDMAGVKVTPDIISLSVYDVANKIIKT
jgi:hypothetical protein